MSIYGDATLRAVELYKNGVEKDPVLAWQSAIEQFTKSICSQEKPCLRNTFLGLCSDGLYERGD
jgi:hypothetical protein